MRSILAIGIILGATLLAGCTRGVAYTGQERWNNAIQAYDMDGRQIVDDWDTLWLQDRQYRLTKWQTR